MAHAAEVSGLFPEQCLVAFIYIEDWRPLRPDAV